MLDREQLESSKRRKTATVELSDDSVLIRTMSGSQREQFLLEVKNAQGLDVQIPPGLQSKVACWSLINPDLTRMFKDDEIHFVEDLDADDLEAILMAALKLSGLTDESSEEVSKNSEADLKDTSGSDSPSLSVAQ